MNEQNTGLPAIGKIYQSLPFYLELGLNVVQGSMGLGENGVRFEWRMYDWAESPKGGLETQDIHFSELIKVIFRKRLFSGKLEINAQTAASISKLPVLPGHLSQFSCTIKRKYLADAAQWAAEANLRIAEHM